MVLYGGKNKKEIIKALKNTRSQIALGLSIMSLCSLGTIYAASEKDSSSKEPSSYVEMEENRNTKLNDAHKVASASVVRTSKQLEDNIYYASMINDSNTLSDKVVKLNYSGSKQTEVYDEEINEEEEEESEEVEEGKDELRENLINSFEEEIALLNDSRLVLTNIDKKINNGLDINKLMELKMALRNREITIDNINEFSMEEIIEFICKKYNLERYQFNTIASTVYHETWSNNYDDCYRVINTIYNRTKCSRWVNYISSLTGPDGNKLDGNSMYAQVVAKSQFNGCVDKTGSDFDELLSEVIYDGTKPFETTLAAIFNFLISEECVHSYLSFKGKDYPIDADKFTDYGNKYHELMQESDVLDPNYVIIEADKSLVLTRK